MDEETKRILISLYQQLKSIANQAYEARAEALALRIAISGSDHQLGVLVHESDTSEPVLQIRNQSARIQSSIDLVLRALQN